jgi:hypothetical protein
VGPRASLDDVEKRKFLTLPGLELQPLGQPAYSHSLYLLHYLGSVNKSVVESKNILYQRIKLSHVL